MDKPPPARKVRWDRLLLAVLLLAGIAAGVVLLLKR